MPTVAYGMMGEMSPRQGTEPRPENVREAFSSFEDSLRAMLRAEAEKSVAEAVERLSAEGSVFRITEISVGVTIEELKVSTGQVRSIPKRRPKAKATVGSRQVASGGRGRPTGTLRNALLGAFSSDGEELSTEDLRQHLEGQGIQAKADNVHQHLGRMVKAGEIARAGRGRYRRI